MEIKLTLQQLVELFAQDAANESMPVPIRRFAAKLTVLAAHIKRVESKIDALDAVTDELARFTALVNDRIGTPAAASAQSAQPASADEPTDADEDNATAALIAKAARDAQEELVVNSTPVAPPSVIAPVTPLPARKKVAASKQSPDGAA